MMHDSMLAFEIGDLVYPIAMLIVAAASGLQHVLKKKHAAEKEHKTGKAAPPKPQRPATRPQHQAQPPAGGPAGRPPAARVPQQRRPTPPAARTGQATQPAPAARRPVPPRPVPRIQPQLRTPPSARPTGRVTGQERDEQVAAKQAAQLAEQAEHLARKREEQEPKEGIAKTLAPVPKRRAVARVTAQRRLIGDLNPQTMKQAILLSEILQPPISIREQDHLK